MIQYKYQLDKSSKKFYCPNCNRQTFVRFVETETNNYLNYEFGRCDRETNCSYYFKPNSVANTIEIKYIAKPQPSFHPRELIVQHNKGYEKNNFILFLKSIFSEVEVKNAITKYIIGSSGYWKGATIFWQVNKSKQVQAGKVLQYNPNTGRRAKDNNGKSLITWIHSILKKKGTIEEFNLNQCLFGLHLVSNNINRVAIVESEKTAIVMSLFKPEYTWLATGSKLGFKFEMLEPIKNCIITAFPDKSECEDWSNISKQLNLIGFKITISNFLENSDYENGTDLADIFITEKRKADFLFNKNS